MLLSNYITLPDSCHRVILIEQEPTQNTAAKNATVSQRAGAVRSKDKRAQVGKENTNNDIRALLEEIFGGPAANFWKFINPNREARFSEFQYDVSNIITKCV